MDYNSYEQEIDLKELMFAVFHKWRPILICAVLLAVLLGGYKAVSSFRGQSDAEAVREARENYEREMEVYDRNVETCEREIDNLTRDIASQQEYVESSILMNMSPYDVWEAKADFFVKTDYEIMPDMVYQNVDLTRTVLQAYRSALTDGNLLEEVAKKSQVDSRYLQELITITTGQDETTSQDKKNNLLTIQVRHNEEAKAQELLDSIVGGIDQYQKQIRSSIGNHTITMVGTSTTSMVDLGLADQQSRERERLERLKAGLDTREKELDALAEPAQVVTSTNAAVKSGMKYGLIGGVLGAFAVIFFVCVAFVMSDRVYSAKELKYRFKVKILGTLPGPEAGKAGRIDAWLNRLEGRAGDKDEDHEYGLIAANIRNYMDGSQALLVTGGAAGERVSRVAAELSSRLSGIKVIAGGNLLHDAECLKKLPQCDGIVLVEECRKSLYSEVELELEKAYDLQKKVAGCVVFE